MSRWIVIDADVIPNIYTATHQELIFALKDSLGASTELIRCGECKYWKSTVQMPNGTEVKCLYGRKDDDFCSYGERNADPNTLNTLDALDDNCSEKPNNSTISILEQVEKDINVRSKDEPQAERSNKK